MTVRSWPLLRPVVCSSTTGMPPADFSNRPPDTAQRARCSAFMLFMPKSTNPLLAFTAQSVGGRPGRRRYGRIS